MAYRYPVLDVIDRVYSILTADSSINTRPRYRGTIDEVYDLSTLFYKYLDFDTTIERLKLKDRKEDLRVFSTPLVLIFNKDRVKYIKDRNNQIDKVTPNHVIQVSYPSYDLESAYLESFKLADDIRQALDPHQGLSGKVSACRVEQIDDMGYLQYDESPYFYSQMCYLDVYTR